jgi:2'-5' RNA ligase
LRLFLAFDVPERPGWHMTVVFLGAREASDVDVVRTTVPGVLGMVGPLEPRRLLQLPRRHPRLLAVEYADPTGRCSALQAAVAGALTDAGLYEPERRRWLPHVSIARLRDDPERPQLDGLAFTPERLVLYESHLGGSRPARYEALEAWELSGD